MKKYAYRQPRKKYIVITTYSPSIRDALRQRAAPGKAANNYTNILGERNSQKKNMNFWTMQFLHHKIDLGRRKCHRKLISEAVAPTQNYPLIPDLSSDVIKFDLLDPENIKENDQKRPPGPNRIFLKCSLGD